MLNRCKLGKINYNKVSSPKNAKYALYTQQSILGYLKPLCTKSIMLVKVWKTEIIMKAIPLAHNTTFGALLSLAIVHEYVITSPQHQGTMIAAG